VSYLVFSEIRSLEQQLEETKNKLLQSSSENNNSEMKTPAEVQRLLHLSRQVSIEETTNKLKKDYENKMNKLRKELNTRILEKQQSNKENEQEQLLSSLRKDISNLKLENKKLRNFTENNLRDLNQHLITDFGQIVQKRIHETLKAVHEINIELVNENDSVKKELHSFQNEVVHLKKEMRESKEKYAKEGDAMQKNLESIQNKFIDLENKVQTKEEKWRSVGKYNEMTKTELKSFQNKVDELESLVSHQEETYKQLVAEKERVKSQLHIFQTKAIHFEGEINQISQKSAESLKLHNAEIEKLKIHYSNAISNREATLGTLSQNRDELESKFTMIAKSNQRLESEIQILRKINNDEKAKAEQAFVKLNLEHSSQLKQNAAELIADKETCISGLILKKEACISALVQEMNFFKQTNTERVEGLCLQLKEYDIKLRGKNTTILQLQSAMDALNASFHSSEEQKTILMSELNTVRGNSETKIRELDECLIIEKQSLLVLQCQNKNQQEQLEKVEMELEATQKSTSRIQSELDSKLIELQSRDAQIKTLLSSENDQVDHGGLEALEHHVIKLSTLVRQKDSEIRILQATVHRQCEERTKLLQHLQ